MYSILIGVWYEVAILKAMYYTFIVHEVSAKLRIQRKIICYLYLREYGYYLYSYGKCVLLINQFLKILKG